MRQHLLTIICICVLGLQVIHSQNKPKLIEYLKSPEPTVTMYVNIFIPSFQQMATDTPQIAIKRKNDVGIFVGYRYRTKPNGFMDTCYISTFTDSELKYYENAGLTASQIGRANEGPCYNNFDGYCNFLILTSEIHYVRFRSAQKTRTYKLLVTD